MIQKYHVPVLTYARTYWPDNRNDMDDLRKEFEQAAHQLRHFTDKVNPARLQAIELGQNYGGHCVPFGYLVVGEKGEKHYVVYEPHARIIRWLFRRYMELGGNLSRLGKEIRDTGVAFPAFTPDVDPLPHVALRKVGACYPIITRGALVSILTNPAYVGWYTLSIRNKETGEVERSWVNKSAHEPIVPWRDFFYAYNRLSDVNLDGEPNEIKPKIDRRYGISTPALLENILECDGTPAYVIARHKAYTARSHNDGWSSTELMIRVALLDGAFTDAMLRVLMALEQQRLDGLQDSLQQELQALHEEKVEEVIDLDAQLANIDKAIRGWELDKQSAREQGYKAGLDEANRQLKRLHDDRLKIEAKAQETTTEAEDLAECQSLHAQAVQDWNSLKFEKQKRFVRLVVQQANITTVTPHMLQLEITLHPIIRATLVGYMYRAKGSQSAWSDEEVEILRSYYPQADRIDILKALPDRTWAAIIQQANDIGMKRLHRLNTSDLAYTITYSDAVIMQETGISADDENTWHWFIADGEVDMALLQAFDTIISYPKRASSR